MSDRHISIVFDASAIIGYTRGSVAVGEMLGEVAEDRYVAALPMLCLVEANRVVTDHDLLMVLVNHDATTLIGSDPADWRSLATTYDTVGRLDAASAVLAAYSLRCLVLTAQPGLYAGLEDGGPIIAF